MMTRFTLCATAVAALTLGACASTRSGEGAEAASAGADGPGAVAADLRNASGAVVARASAEETGDGLRVRVEASAMAPGAYGAHIHMVGRCEAPDFASAGAHWNPTARQHGRDNPAGMHKGDLPNLLVGADGRGSFEYVVPDARLSGRGGNVLIDGDGAAIVVHAAADDQRSDPSGNSGARIACGVLG